jgi:RNA polymerase sigma-70 factor (ECF subfamily)
MESDYADLVRAVAGGGAGGRGAESEICRRFAPRIRLYGLRHLRSEDRAADLVQLVLLATLEAIRAGRLEDPTRLDRFILGVSRHTASGVRARERRLEPRAPEDLDVGAMEMNVEKVDLGALFRCISALEGRPRTVVYLSYQEERSAEEIATILETTPANVRVLRHRAVAQLRTCLDGKAARG